MYMLWLRDAGDKDRSWLKEVLSGVCADWSERVRVEAWVVDLQNPAAADNVGLLQPLLRKLQTGAASFMVFGLPPVLVSNDRLASSSTCWIIMFTGIAAVCLVQFTV
jgi:hypothetical protein